MAETHPPKARLALRVGVVGHREEHLPADRIPALRVTARQALEDIHSIVHQIHAQHRGEFSEEEPLLSVVSRLASGADQIIAEAAVTTGYALQCVLPFPREDYAGEIQPAHAREKYVELLARARSVLELDGARDAEDKRLLSFLEAKRAVLRNCDVLIAVFDPEQMERRGTRRVLSEAFQEQTPTIYISPRSPHERTFRPYGSETSVALNVTQLKELLERLVLPLELDDPNKKPSRIPESIRRLFRQPSPRKYYFHETQRHLTMGILGRTFRDLVAMSAARLKRLPGFRVSDFEGATEVEWNADWNDESWNESARFPRDVVRGVDDAFRIQYAWADKLASYYGDLMRSSFVFNYLAGALAVLFALLGYALGWAHEGHPFHKYENVWILGELVLIVLIVSNTAAGNYWRWHDRWIDYRLLAEHLRLQRFLLPLGRVTPDTGLPAHLSYGDARGSWMYWHFRAVARQAGLIQARMDRRYVEACRTFLTILVKGQTKYHKDNEELLEKVDHRLHAAGMGLFILTAAACLMHLFVHTPWLTLVNAVFPALGAALAAIQSQGEFERVARRSRGMFERLSKLASDLERVGCDRGSSASLGRIAEEIADCMSSEVLDWRTLFKGKPLVLPA